MVLLCIDTLRADRVGCIGRLGDTTPSIDELAKRGTVFERAMAPSGWSLPSFGSFLTSLPEPALGLVKDAESIEPHLTTLPEIYSTFGYRTAGFVGGGHLSQYFGFDQGFDTYKDRPHFASFFHTVPPALEWVRSADQRPFFLMVHGYDAHAPYPVPLGMAEMYDPGYEGIVHDEGLLTDERMSRVAGGIYRCIQLPARRRRMPMPGWSARLTWAWERLRYLWYRRFAEGPAEMGETQLEARDFKHFAAHYDAAVTYADTWLGVFLEGLKRSGKLDNTLIVVAGDHGEELGEHGVFGHKRSMWNCILHVPLIIAGPGVAQGRRVGDVTELIDVAPTLLELCGIPPFQAHRGRSLKPALDPAAAPVEELEKIAFSARAETMSARTRRWHLIVEPSRRQLFDVQADPAEHVDVQGREPQVTERLTSQIKDWDERYRVVGRTSAVTLTPEEKETFRAHGYW